MNTLTKAEFIDILFSELEIEKKDAKLILETFFESMTNALINNEEIKLSGFGNFMVRHKAERHGRNPKTGEYAPIKERRSVSFKAAKNKRMCRK